MKKIKTTKILYLILFFSFFVRVFNLQHPKAYIFDEVYCGFTAQQFAKGNIKAWEWWNSAPKGFAYCWTHPQLAKLIMAVGVLFFGRSQFGFRFPAAVFGTGVIYLIYLLAKKIFNNENIALSSAFLASFDGLLLVMSRTGMLDIFVLFFLLATVYLAVRRKYFWAWIFLGLSLASKWIGLYLYPVTGILLLKDILPKFKKFEKRKLFAYSLTRLLAYFTVPILVYILAHAFFFSSGHTWNQFIELQKQMWNYHTKLVATHDRQSKALSWPFMIRPVWFWVDYKKTTVANIYNLGNPILWWSGVLLLPLTIWQAIQEARKKRQFQLLFVVFCYFSFFLPWVFSPRIMFLHHYMPALPFLCILTAWQLDKIKNLKFLIAGSTVKGIKKKRWEIKGDSLIALYFLLIALTFFLFYPLNTGLHLPQKLVKYLFWLPSWK